jgi:hypothetical protein
MNLNLTPAWFLDNLRDLKRAGVPATRARYRYPPLDSYDLRLFIVGGEIRGVQDVRDRLRTFFWRPPEALVIDRGWEDRQ